MVSTWAAVCEITIAIAAPRAPSGGTSHRFAIRLVTAPTTLRSMRAR